MEGITKGWAVALAITVIALVVVFSSSILFAFQSSVSSRTSYQATTTMTESLAPRLDSSSISILLIANENLLRIAPDNDLYPGGSGSTR